MSYEDINPKDYIYRRKEETKEEIFDETNEFLEVIKKFANKAGFGGIIWIIGIPESGKSALLCIICNLLLKFGMKKRNVAFYQAPEKLLEAIQNAVPEEIKDKFRIIETLSEVKPFDILCIDEGYLSADAKSALTNDSKNFIASITTLRHSSVFTILNSLDNGILRGYRLKAQFRFYKTISDGYIEEVNDKFAKKYGEQLTALMSDQTVFRITHIKFLRKGIRKGALVLPLKKYCTWYNDEISRNFEGEDFDALMRRLYKKKRKMESVIQLLIDEFGEDLNRKIAEGFLFDKYIEIYKEFQSDIGNIVKVAQYRMYKEIHQEENSHQQRNMNLEVPAIIHDESNDTSCANFFKAYYFNNLPFDKDKKYILDIIHLWILGLPQRKIAYETSYGITTINRLIQKYNSGKGLDSDLLRTKTVYEYWIAKATYGLRGGKQSEPDIWYEHENNIIGCGECKLIDDISTTLTFYLQALGNKKNKKMTLEPAYTYCKSNGIRFFPFYLRNPKWGNIDMVIIIDVNGDNKITVSKSLMNNYLLPQGVNSFDAYSFFTEQEEIISAIN